MKRLAFVLFVSGLTGMLSLGGFWPAVAQAHSTKKFSVDVACNLPSAGFNTADGAAFPPTFGPRATVVIVNGNIYPRDSLEPGLTPFLPDPTDPNKIGTWRCQFASLGEFDFPLRLIGAVTYYFQLEPTGYDPDESMIMVQGLNSHTFVPGPDSVPRVLAVVGGTGKYAGATGEVREEVLGRNVTGCFNMRFHFRISGVRHRRSHDWDKDDD